VDDPVDRLPTVWQKANAVLLTGVVAVGLAQATLSIALTLGMTRVFDLALDRTLAPTPIIAAIGLGFFLFGSASAVLRYGERTLSERLGQLHVHRVRLRLWHHLQGLPAALITGQRRGATVLRFLGDLTTLKVWVSRGLVSSAVAGLTLLGGVTAMALLSWKLASYIVLALVLAIAMQARWNRVVGRRLRELRRRRTRLATDVVERISCLPVIQAMNQTKRERRRLRKRSEDLVRASVQAASASGILLGGGEFISVALMGTVIVLGTMEVGSGALTPGAMVASLLLARHLGRPVRRLSRTHEQWLRFGVARRKLEQFLALDPIVEPAKAVPLKNGGGAIRLARVSSGRALARVSGRAKAGDRIRLVGENGSGKSTLLRILAGLERPQSGVVGVDGRDLSRCRLKTIRSAVALVGPDLPLMRGSLRRNLTYGRPGATASQIREVMEICDLEGFVKALPEGLDAHIGDGGSSLSTGQRHRVRLARALLRHPRLLLLDEADCFLDERGRLAMKRVIDSFPGTVLFVWNGLGAPPATAIWRLRNGEITVERDAETQQPEFGSGRRRTTEPFIAERRACAS
jgi:ABC-type multidrug transport system fused ATPase/permease subunit